MVRELGNVAPEGDSPSIVASYSAAGEIEKIPAQSSRAPRSTLLNATEETPARHEFGERHQQQHLLSCNQPQHAAFSLSTTPVSAVGNIAINQNGTQPPMGNDLAGAMVNQSWLTTTSSGVPTTSSRREYSHAETLVKRTDDSNREPTSLDFTSDINSIQQPQEHQQHHFTTPNIPLATLSQPTPLSHAATAADIALGIPSSYNLTTHNRNHQHAMVHDSRIHNRATEQDSSTKEADTSSMVESFEGKEREEDNTSRTSDTGLVTSPGRMTPLLDTSDHAAAELPRISATGIGTPSTVSTAPSTDDASFGTDYKLDDSFLPNLLQPSSGHSRSHSFGEEGLFPGSHLEERAGAWAQPSTAPSLAPQQLWAGLNPGAQQRVASFRERDGEMFDPFGGRYLQSSSHRGDPLWPQQPQHVAHHQPQQQHRHFPVDQHIQYASHQNRNIPTEMRQVHPQQHFGAYQQGQRKQTYPQTQHGAISPVATPPRGGRGQGQRLQGQASHRQTPPSGQAGSPHQPSSNTQRSSSEILKTLLRKKACLYEPDTSRSVALVTWLVGRELALEYGFFSRQQLQSGVHACVSEKIDSGTITRTKVNRCMQIILNSCFHYIIPRSDGTEEKGDSFRELFAKSVQDDSFLLRYLPEPWNDLRVEREIVLEASLAEVEEKPVAPVKSPSTPKSSPKVTSLNADRSPGKDSKDGDDLESKRAVLLCFNENVRSAEDVFRCHNEFIRDTANAAHLQLTAQEWRTFFGREAARAPYLWGNVGIPLSASEIQGGPTRQPDLLGQMSQDEVGKFRTSWCAKRYDHDHELCGFAHVEVNGGWLRRNPTLFPYEDVMCRFVSTVGDKRVSSSYFFVNECPLGVNCESAHSMEEILYHPKRYKTKTCSAVYSRSGGCQMGDVCPNLHPADSTRPLKKPNESRSHGMRHARKNDQNVPSSKTNFVPPTGSPVIYASPAPFSSFERQLTMPGLQNLFRRHCSVIRAHVRTSGKCNCTYSCFGDDWGISNGTSLAPNLRSGLPPTRRV